MMRDYQRSRVYRWEDKYVAPLDKSRVPFDQIQGIVNYVWEGEGLQHPPKVEPLPKQATTKCGDANRLTIRFHKNNTVPTWVILHEMAHSLTALPDQSTNEHREYFVGMYVQLLTKYLGIDPMALRYTLSKAGVKFETNVEPLFLQEENYD